MPRAGQVVAAYGKAAEQSGAGQDGTPTGRFAQETTVPLALQGLQGIEHKSLEHLFGNTVQINPMSTDGGTKPAVDNWFIRGLSLGWVTHGLSAGKRPLFVSGC